MTFIFKFLFKSDDNYYVGEKKYINLPKDAPIYLKYQWITYYNEKEKNLTFKSMDGNKREFEEGKLEMFENNTYCIFNNKKYVKVDKIE